MLILRRLEDILHILQLKQIEAQSNNYNPGISRTAPANTHGHNRFASLSSKEDIYEQETEVDDKARETTVKEQRSINPDTVDFDNGFDLEDDDLGEWIELSYVVYVSHDSLNKIVAPKTNTYSSKSLDAILDQTNKYWAEAASGTLPVCLAAWLSCTAFFEVGMRYNEFDFDKLLQKWTRHRLKQITIQFTDIPGLQSETRRFADITRLSFHRHLLQTKRTRQGTSGVMLEALSRQNIPLKNLRSIIAPVSQDDKQSAFLDYLTMDRILEHMRRSLVSKRGIAAIESPSDPQPICEPLLPFIDTVFSATERPISVQVIFGMEMLLSSYKIYTWPDGVFNENSPRILAIQLSLEVQKSLSETIKRIQGRNSVSEVNLPHLQKVLDGLESYAREIRFDLYYQAPWTAGCHMIQIITTAMFEGQHLCHGTGYLCALLHLYNALRNTDPSFRQINLLNQLCEIWRDKLFLGALPNKNFSSSFRSAMGGRLTKKKSTNRMELSKPTPGCSTRVTGTTRLSTFFDMHTFGYEPSADFWHLNFEGIPRWQPTTERERDEAVRRAYSSPLADSLNKIKENVAQEFKGPLPVARINYFAVFIFAANSMEELCKSFTAGKEQMFEAHMDLGFSLVDDLLVQIVDHLQDSRGTFLLPYWRPVSNAKRFFNGLDGNLSLDDFLWKSSL